jgi:hypothetical protein
MAVVNQALTVFEEDRLTLRFTFSDLTTNFNTSWKLWIGFAVNSTWPTTTTLIRAKASTGWTYGSSPGTINDNNVAVINNSNVMEVYFTQNDFSSDGSGNTLQGGEAYYFELVVSNDGTEDNSIVAATGIFTVEESLFTVNGFRP